MEKITAKEYEEMVAKENIEWAKRQGVDLENGIVTREDAFKLATREACERRLVLAEIKVTDKAVKKVEEEIRVEKEFFVSSIDDLYDFYLFLRALDRYGYFWEEAMEVEDSYDEYDCMYGEGEAVLVEYA